MNAKNFNNFFRETKSQMDFMVRFKADYVTFSFSCCKGTNCMLLILLVLSIQTRVWMSPDHFSLALFILWNCRNYEIVNPALNMLHSYSYKRYWLYTVSNKQKNRHVIITPKSFTLFITQNIILFNIWITLASHFVFHPYANLGPSS